jgi:ADP-ribose pyrophosphatase YjhB (NUDIX family)
MRKIIAFVYKVSYPLALGYWFITRPKTSGVRCIIRHQDKILLIQHMYGHQLLTVPGGGIRAEETQTAAARREIREEVGLEIINLKKIAAVPFREEFKRDTIYIYEAEVLDTVLTIDPTEIKQANWYDVNSLPTNISSVVKPYLRPNA